MKRRGEMTLLAVAAVVIMALSAFWGLHSESVIKRDVAIARLERRACTAAQRAQERARTGSSAADISARTDPPARREVSEIPPSYPPIFSKARDTHRRSSLYFGAVTGKPPEEWSVADRARAQEALTAAQDVVAALRQAAYGSIPAFPIPASGTDEFQALARDQLDCRGLLCADAAMKAAEGDDETAVEDILAAMRLIDVFGCNTHANYSQMARVVQAAFPKGRPRRDLALKLVSHAAQADHREAFSHSLVTEGLKELREFTEYSNMSWHDRMAIATIWHEVRSRANWVPLGDIDTQPGATIKVGDVPNSLILYASPIGAPMRAADEQVYAELVDRLVDAAARPYYEARPILLEIDQFIESLPVTRAFARVHARMLLGTFRDQARHEALLDMMQMALLLNVFYAENGQYPSSLDAIAGDLSGSLPVDPFTGEPYHYVRHGDDFLLYSVGPDLADDGGVPPQKDKRQGLRRYTSTGSDLVWLSGGHDRGASPW